MFESYSHHHRNTSLHTRIDCGDNNGAKNMEMAGEKRLQDNNLMDVGICGKSVTAKNMPVIFI